jgi:hypothetical protein
MISPRKNYNNSDGEEEYTEFIDDDEDSKKMYPPPPIATTKKKKYPKKIWIERTCYKSLMRHMNQTVCYGLI